MTYKIAYGTDTGSLEDPDQLVLALLPEKCRQMESEELQTWMKGNPFRTRDLVTVEEALDDAEITVVIEDGEVTRVFTVMPDGEEKTLKDIRVLVKATEEKEYWT